jgi:cellobiose phosphorylase
MNNKYGYFDDLTNEYVINTWLTPRSWENRMWNQDLNMQITNHGTGIIYRKDHEGSFVLYNWSGNRALYILNKTTGNIWSPAWYPVNKDLSFYEVRHGLNYTEIFGELDGIKIAWKTTVHPTDPTEVCRIEIENSTDESCELLVVPFYEIDLSFKDPYFGPSNLYKSTVLKETNSLFIKNFSPKRNLEYYALCYHSDIPIDKYEMDKDSFLKNFSSLSNPYTVLNDDFKNSEPDLAPPVFAVGYDINLQPNEHKAINTSIFSIESKELASTKAQEYGTNNLYEEARKTHESFYKKFLAENTIDTCDQDINRFMNVWIKQQLRYNAMWNRGWNLGFRDSMQDCDSFRRHDNNLVLDRIINAAKHIYADGHTVRAWAAINTKMYFDGGIWFLNTTTNYIKETGDFDILKQTIKYLDEGEGTILEHMKKCADFLNNQRGSGGICRMGFGDWNDALNGIDREGKGESVWTSMAFIWALTSFIELLEYISDDSCISYKKVKEGLKELLNNNYFEEDRYIRAVTDAGDKVGSKTSKGAKLFLNTQSWAMISEIADKERSKIILKTVKENLYTDFGPVLLSPPYTEYDEAIGRITSDEPGYIENGANYVHAAMFYAYGLARAGLADEALKIIRMVLPDNPKNPYEKSLLEPFNVTNALEGNLSKHPGRAKFAWRTGSAGWMLKTIWDGIFGILPGFEDIRIEANIPKEFLPIVSANRKIRGKNYTFIFTNDKSLVKDYDIVVENNSSFKYNELGNKKKILVNISK